MRTVASGRGAITPLPCVPVVNVVNARDAGGLSPWVSGSVTMM